jgi:hypothetical protein
MDSGESQPGVSRCLDVEPGYAAQIGRAIVREERLGNATTAMGPALPPVISARATQQRWIVGLSHRTEPTSSKISKNAVHWTSGRLCIFLGRVPVGSTVLNKFPRYAHSRDCARILLSSNEEGRLLLYVMGWPDTTARALPVWDNCYCFEPPLFGKSPTSLPHLRLPCRMKRPPGLRLFVAGWKPCTTTLAVDCYQLWCGRIELHLKCSLGRTSLNVVASLKERCQA